MFISFDGIDGCGKNTQVNMLKSTLSKNGHNVKVLDFGGDPEFKKIITEINQKKILVSPIARELIYYFEGLYTNINCIQKYKNTHDIIIDRYYLSYYAYGMENGFTYDQISYFTKNLIEPDVYFYLDCCVDNTKQRILSIRQFDAPEIGFYNTLTESNKETSIDQKFCNFQNRVRDNYLNLLKPSHICIDARQSKEEIHRRVLYEIQKYRK